MFSSRSDLSDFDRVPIARWAEDETFYSVCSRQHILLSNTTASSTAAWLFGSPSATTAHDLPYNLASLNGAAQSHWGTPHSIIFNHTILPFFLPFQSAQNAVVAMQAMESPNLGSLKYKLGLLTGRFGAEHPLKACTSCMKADVAAHGFAYWHLPHQYPGVLVCPRHGEMLRESSCNRQWSGRFQWVLPSESTIAPAQDPAPASSLAALEQFATAVIDLAAFGVDRHFQPHIVKALYKDAWKVDRKRLVMSFAHHCSLLQPYPPLASLPASPQQVPVFWAQLTRTRQSRCHPLKHLIVISWLYGSVGSFIKAYDRAAGRQPAQGRPAECNGAVFQACEPLRRDPSCATPRKHKPKVLKPLIRNDILRRLRRGAPKSDICAEFRITISTVNKLLRSEPDVRRSWMEKSLTARMKKHRAQWIAATAADPNRTPQEIRALAPSVYAWLYRNDREWLLSQTRELPSGRRGNNSLVDWAKRDDALLAQVSRTVGELGASSLEISRRSLLLACPTLGSALEKHGRYPHTRAFLKSLILA